LIARNERPLEAKEQSKEEQKLQRIAEERRKERRSVYFTKRLVSDPSTTC